MIRGIATLILLFSLGACVTPAQFKDLRSRVVTLEKNTKANTALLEKHNARLDRLSDLLKNAKSELQKSGADTMANLDEVLDNTRRNQGAIEETRFLVDRQGSLLDQLVSVADKKLGVTVAATAAPVPEDVTEVYQLAKDELNGKRYREARSLFQKYLQEAPTGESAADAQFYIGETYRGEGDHESAIQAYKVVHSEYRKSERMPEALLRIGDSLVSLNECAKAKKVYALLLRDAKKSPQASVAKERTAGLKDKCKKKK